MISAWSRAHVSSDTPWSLCSSHTATLGCCSCLRLSSTAIGDGIASFLADDVEIAVGLGESESVRRSKTDGSVPLLNGYSIVGFVLVSHRAIWSAYIFSRADDNILV